MISKKILRIRKQLCSGAMRKKIEILERDFTSGDADDLNGEDKFTSILKPSSLVDTVKGSKRFAGVNIDDSITHVFSINYTPMLRKMDGDGNFYISYLDAIYRIMIVLNIDEDNKILQLFCSDQGDSSQVDLPEEEPEEGEEETPEEPEEPVDEDDGDLWNGWS